MWLLNNHRQLWNEMSFDDVGSLMLQNKLWRETRLMISARLRKSFGGWQLIWIILYDYYLLLEKQLKRMQLWIIISDFYFRPNGYIHVAVSIEKCTAISNHFSIINFMYQRKSSIYNVLLPKFHFFLYHMLRLMKFYSWYFWPWIFKFNMMRKYDWYRFPGNGCYVNKL